MSPALRLERVDRLDEAGLPVDQQPAPRIYADILTGGQLGNATAERGTASALDRRTTVTRRPDGRWDLNGVKYYATGTLGARWIAVAALVVAVVDWARAEGSDPWAASHVALSPLLVPLAQALVATPLVVRTLVPALGGVDDRQRQAAASLGAPPWRHGRRPPGPPR